MEPRAEVYTPDPVRLRRAFREFREAVRRDYERDRFGQPILPRLSREAEELLYATP